MDVTSRPCCFSDVIHLSKDLWRRGGRRSTSSIPAEVPEPAEATEGRSSRGDTEITEDARRRRALHAVAPLDHQPHRVPALRDKQRRYK
jgi:hypothetical protein